MAFLVADHHHHILWCRYCFVLPAGSFLCFIPKKLDPSHVFVFDVPFEELKIPFNKTDTMSLVKFFPKDSVRKGVILYYHGNMDNIERYAGFAADFTRKRL
jgi:hypothetical protein